MKGSLMRLRPLAAVAAATALVLTGATTASAGAGCTFKLVQHPEVGDPSFDRLYGIDAASSDIWAVGCSGNSSRRAIGRG